MNDDQIQPILTNLGLNHLEVYCYLELLKKSPQKASQLSKKFGIPKATVLMALYRLVDYFGIIKRSKQKNTFLFLVEDADDLLRYANQKERESQENKKTVEQLLPQMRSMMNLDAIKPQVFYYEGKEGLKRAFEQVLEEADEIIGYGSDEDDVKYLPEIYPKYYGRRVKKKIPVKAIIPATDFNIKDSLEKETQKLRQNRLIPKEFNYPIQINIYKHAVVFYSFEESFALIIKSRPIAGCLKMIFNLAFERAGEFNVIIRNQNARQK